MLTKRVYLEGQSCQEECEGKGRGKEKGRRRDRGRGRFGVWSVEK